MKTRSLLAVLALLLAACQPSAVPSAGTTAAPTAAPTPVSGKPTGTVTVAYPTFDLEVLEPSLGTISVTPYYGPMFNTLIGATPGGEPSTQYGLLEAYKISPDGRVFSMTLRKNAKWHDGVEITSDDIKFTIEHSARAEAKCVTCAFLRANLDRVEIIDRYGAALHLKQPNVAIVNLLAPIEGDLAVLPKHHFEKVGARFGEQPLGSGPWKFVQKKLGQFIEYEANEDYWNKERVPGFQRLRVLLVPDAKTRVAMMRAKEADLALIGPEDVEPLRKDGFKIDPIEMTTMLTAVFFRSYDPNFLSNRLEFRKALVLAVDVDAIVKAFYPREVGTRATGGPLFNPLTPGYDPSMPSYPYNLGEAKRLLEQVGYKGQPVNFWSFQGVNNPEQVQVNELIADYWRKAGINVRLMPVDFAAWSLRYRAQPQNFEGPADVAVMFPGPRPSLVGNIQVWMNGQADGGIVSAYHDPSKAIRVYRQLTSTQDAAERQRILSLLNRELYEEYWAMPIVWRHGTFAVGSRVSSWQPSKGTALHLAFETLKPSGK
jgi:peptide/nickel transport system substrate-binding protein